MPRTQITPIQLYQYNDGYRQILNVKKYINPINGTVNSNHSTIDGYGFDQKIDPINTTNINNHLVDGVYLTNNGQNVSSNYNDCYEGGNDDILTGYYYCLGTFAVFSAGRKFDGQIVVKTSVAGKTSLPNMPNFLFSNETGIFVDGGIYEDQDYIVNLPNQA